MKELKEVEQHLIKLSRTFQPGRWQPESYIGAGESKFIFLNLKTPHIRQASKEGYSFSNSELSKQWKIWDQIWRKTPYFEVALSAVHFANSRPIEELVANQNLLLKWQERVDNWGFSDELSNCFARLYEQEPKKYHSIFQTWNSSKNPWKRRQSIVGILFYSRFRKKAPTAKTILKLVEPLLDDDHYYVKKGVGWTLRECWNLYPSETMKFMEKQAHRIPPAGWTAATEKLSKLDKARLTELRKNNH